MHSGKRDLPYTSSHSPAKPSEFPPSSPWDAPSSGEKAGNRRTRATPSRPAAQEGRAGRHPEPPGADRITSIFKKQVWMWLLPYGFAAVLGPSQTLPDERCRLWLKESLSYSHNQMLPVVLPAETDWRAWFGHSCTGSTLFLFPLSPESFPSNHPLELTVLLQQTTKLHSLKTS